MRQKETEAPRRKGRLSKPLKGYRDLSFEQFGQDETRCHAALYVQTVLEAMTDIGNQRWA